MRARLDFRVFRRPRNVGPSVDAMVFKPFKPPLIRKPEPTKEPDQANDQEHPTKKPRLQKEDQSGDPETRPTVLASRKPLLQVQNVGKDSSVKPPPGGVSKEDASFERFFNALWLVISTSDLSGPSDE